MKILLVDDEKDILDITGDAIASLGYEVVCASDGEEALEKLDDTYKIVLTDWMMPRMNGLEVLQAIKKRNPATYVILFSAKSTQDNIMEGLVAGANDYITKPFELSDLELRLHIAVASIELNKIKRTRQR